MRRARSHLPSPSAAAETPDGMKLSKRVHGPVVSVAAYRDAGFLRQSFMNFLCLLGGSPKNDREKLSRGFVQICAGERRTPRSNF
jgi:glutamyl/glutaminyl-tRNA synthetase